MIKNICTLLILFSTVISYGQNFTLLKNNNPKAKELKHSLNHANDSLILGCETKIIQVEIFNEDYEKKIIVDDFKSQISLRDIPEGKFVVETKLDDKIIVLGLMRYDFINETTSNSTRLGDKKDTAGGKGMMLDDKLNIVKSSPNKSIAFILTRTKTKTHTSKKQKFYWVVTKINNESGSSKTMKLANKESVDRMILKHKQELNSVSGKLNQLTIWEVYNTSKFMEQQMLNSEFFYSVTSDVFNTTPYYSTHTKVANL